MYDIILHHTISHYDMLYYGDTYIYIYIYIYMYIYIYIYIYREREMYVCIYIYIYRERERYTHTFPHICICDFIVALYVWFIFAPRGQGSLSRNGQTVSFGAASAASDGSPSSTTSPKGAELVINDLSLSLSISLSLSLSLYIYIYTYTHMYMYI